MDVELGDAGMAGVVGLTMCAPDGAAGVGDAIPEAAGAGVAGTVSATLMIRGLLRPADDCARQAGAVHAASTSRAQPMGIRLIATLSVRVGV